MLAPARLLEHYILGPFHCQITGRPPLVLAIVFLIIVDGNGRTGRIQHNANELANSALIDQVRSPPELPHFRALSRQR